MDTGRFDSLARTLSQGASRRTLFARVAAGGAAAAFAALGVRQAQAGDIAAERRRRRRKSSSNTGSTTTLPPLRCDTITGVVQKQGGQDNGTACTGGSPAACGSGFCTATLCQPCPTPCTVSGILQCCPNGSTCVNNTCSGNCVQPPPVTTTTSTSNSSGKKRRKRKKH